MQCISTFDPTVSLFPQRKSTAALNSWQEYCFLSCLSCVHTISSKYGHTNQVFNSTLSGRCRCIGEGFALKKTCLSKTQGRFPLRKTGLKNKSHFVVRKKDDKLDQNEGFYKQTWHYKCMDVFNKITFHFSVRFVAIVILWPNKEICMTWCLESTSAFTFVVSLHDVQIR